ncbi:MAG: DUF1127 domain-containing protein [Acetobacteraceae bacterium]|nr:DUF1127 domain-containing protein [Acetobacteraceae bacterium]
MSAHASKEQLGLTLPGTLNHYYEAEPQYLDAPPPGAFSRVLAAFLSWRARRATIAELSALSDAQLADIGISRGEVPMLYDAAFRSRREQDRSRAMLTAGRTAGA